MVLGWDFGSFYSSSCALSFGVYRGMPIFLISGPNIDCGYPLEPPYSLEQPHRGGSNVYLRSVF